MVARYFNRKTLFLVLLGFSGSVWAQEHSSMEVSKISAESESNESRHDQLLSKIAELQAQLDALKAEVSGRATVADQKTAGAISNAMPVQELTSAKETSPPLGKGVYSLGDRVRIGGYGSARYEANDIGGNHFVPGGSAKGFTFRRLVITTDAHPSDRLQIYSEIEFERLLELEIERKIGTEGGALRFEQGVEGPNGGSIELEQAWAQFNFAKNHGFRFGIVLAPLGRFNINHDDDYWDVPRRTLTDRDAPVLPVKSAWREMGAGFVGHTRAGSSGQFNYQFYVLGGATLNFALNQIVQAPGSSEGGKLVSEAELGLGTGAFDGTRSAQAVSYRLAYSPRLGSEIAFSGYHGKYTPPFLSVSERINAFGVDGNFKHKGFEVEGEFIASDFGNVQNVVRKFGERIIASSAEGRGSAGDDLSSEIEFSLEGLARRRYGFWTDFKYHWRPQFLKGSFLGRGFEDPVLIPIFRYERVWLKDLVTELGIEKGLVSNLEQENRSQDRFTLGLSYRPVPTFAFQLAYEHNERRSGSALIFPALPLHSTNGFLAGLSFGF